MAGVESKGQLVLEGMGNPPKIELATQYNFAYIVQPELWGVEPRALGVEDYEHMALMAPSVLTDRLLPSTGGPATRQYRDDNGRIVHVALTPEEYGLVVGNVRHLGERAVNQSLKRRRNETNIQNSNAAAQRAGGHALNAYIDKMEKYTTNVLEKDQIVLTKFREYAEHPNFRRMRGDNFQINLAWLRGHIFEDMFTALGRQRNWGQEQELLARRALDSRLFLDRHNNAHIENWREMLDFELFYTSHKWALFKTRTQEAKQHIKRQYGQ